MLARNLSATITLLLVPAFLLVLIFLTVFVAHARVYEPIAERGARGAGATLLPTLADFSYKRRVFEVLGDVIVIVLAYYAAFLLRFDGVMELRLPSRQFVTSLRPMVIVLQLSAFLALGLYDGLWRYTSLVDLSRQMRAVGGG